MTDGGLYEKVLHAIEGGAAPLRSRPPRPSAAVVLWRRSSTGELETYWVRRSPVLRFMGGWRAFPGGGVGRQDREIAIAGRPRGVGEAPRSGGMPDRFIGDAGPLTEIMAPGVVAAALRELFEETGLLPVDGELPSPARTVPLRRALLAGEKSFAEAIAELQVTPSAAELVYGGRWMTPPLGPLRFDNRFFLLEWPRQRAQQPEILVGELVSGEWVSPAAALEGWSRGGTMAAPPILHVLRVLAKEGPEAGLSRLWDAQEANLGSLRHVEFRPGIVLFPLATPTLPPATHTNCYLVGFEDSVLVDPGTPDVEEQDRLLEALSVAAERLGRTVEAIWLTHHHPDHVGGVKRLRENLNVPVLAHHHTAEKLRAIGIPVDGELADGEELSLRGEPKMRLRVLWTPGHARGHLCFLDVDRGSLIAGDMVSAVSTIVIDPPEGDMQDYLASLSRLRELDLVTLFPAHGPAIADPTTKLTDLIEHRLWREEKILEAWKSGLREPRAMLPTVYADVPERAWPLAERQIEAHLEHLRRAGRLDEK
jgi:ribonuclease/clavin/mitogillin